MVVPSFQFLLHGMGRPIGIPFLGGKQSVEYMLLRSWVRVLGGWYYEVSKPPKTLYYNSSATFPTPTLQFTCANRKPRYSGNQEFANRRVGGDRDANIRSFDKWLILPIITYSIRRVVQEVVRTCQQLWHATRPSSGRYTTSMLT